MKYVIQVRTPKGIFILGDYLEHETEMILACGLHEMEHVMSFDTPEQAQNLVDRIRKDLDAPDDAFEIEESSAHPFWVEEMDTTPLPDDTEHFGGDD